MKKTSLLFLAGFGLALLALLPVLIKPDLSFYYLLIVAIAIPGIYIAFLWKVTDKHIRSHELIFFAIFSVAVLIGFLTEPFVMIPLIALHSLWDFYHMKKQYTHVPEWYPAFCIFFDITFSAFAFLLITELK